MANDLPVDLERFVLHNLRSLEHLDALLAIYRERTRWWTGEMLATTVGIPVSFAERILEDLCSANLLAVRVSSTLAYQFNAGSPDLERQVRDLVEVLRHARVRIYTLITSRSSRALRDFADAFRLRGRRRG